MEGAGDGDDSAVLEHRAPLLQGVRACEGEGVRVEPLTLERNDFSRPALRHESLSSCGWRRSGAPCAAASGRARLRRGRS